MEQWKHNKKYTNYEMSTEGRIRNSKTGRIMKTSITKKGYEQVCLYRDKKMYTENVHRLIADTFIDGDNSGLDVRHKNYIRSDNRIDNLEYCTRQETVRGSFERGRRPSVQSKVRVIETGEIFNSVTDCARALGLSRCDISKCINRVAYSHGGLHFEKVE